MDDVCDLWVLEEVWLEGLDCVLIDDDWSQVIDVETGQPMQRRCMPSVPKPKARCQWHVGFVALHVTYK